MSVAQSIARPITVRAASAITSKQLGSSSVVAAAPTDIDQLLLDGTNAAHYTTAQWSGFEHLLKDQKTDVGTLRTPRAGRCWLFDGSNDYATRGARLTTGSISTLTVSCWVKFTAGSANAFVSEYSSGAPQWTMGCFSDAGFATANKFTVWLSTDGGTTNFKAYSSATSINDGAWHHCAFTWDNGTLKLYVDGVEETTTKHKDVSFTTIFSSTNHLFVGGLSNQNYMGAKSVRDARVYSSAKSASEILAIKNQADTPGTYDTTGLLAGYWCEEESGTTGYDWSGNGRHLTLTNITQSTFHASDTGLTYSDANVRGFDQFKRFTPSGSGSSYDSTNTWISTTPLTGDFTVRLMPFNLSNVVCGVQSETSKIASNNYTQIDVGVQVFGSDVRVHVNNVITTHTVATAHAVTDVWSIVRVGTTASIYQNGVLVTTKTIASSTMYATVTNSTSDAAAIAYNSGLNMEQDSALLGSNQTTQMLIVPAISSTVAANGATLSHMGKCPQPGYAPQKVATFDGTNDYATLGAKLTSGTITSLTISVWVKPNANGGFETIASEWRLDGNRSWILWASSGGLSFYNSDDGNNGASSGLGSSIPLSVWTHIAVTYNAGLTKTYINGVLSSSGYTSYNSLFSSSAPFQVAAYDGAGVFNGGMSDLRVYSSVKSDAEILSIKRGTQDTTNLLGQWPMCEGPGSGNTNTTIYDVSGNGKHLTVTNATVSSFWANASTYDSCIPNHPLKYGYTINGSGVIVPALISGASDAAGNAIGQAAGGWASGLQNLNCLPYTNPLGVSVGLETSLDPTADRKTTSSSKRRRRNTSGRYDRFGARSTAMSDASSNAYFGD